MNKQGMFFTILSISLISLFLLSYSFYTVFQDRNSINKRIETMNNYIFSLEEDLQRKLYISGFRIIFLFQERIIESGSYLNDINSSFEEAFFNGTIEGSVSEEEATLIAGTTYPEILSDINNKSIKLNIDVNFSYTNVTIIQEDPWEIKVTLETYLFIRDQGDLVTWNRTYVTTAYVPIENFEDPLYIVNTNALVSNKINKTIYRPFVNGGVNNLTKHVDNKLYINSTSAPNYLRRLEGDLSSDPNGIESLVNILSLTAQGIGPQDKSIVDYIYFSGTDPLKCNVNGMPSWFKLDNQDDHHSVYEVAGILGVCS